MTIATVSAVNREALSRPLNARRRNGVWHACCLIFSRRCAYPLSRRLSGCFLLCGKGELAAPRGVQRVLSSFQAYHCFGAAPSAGFAALNFCNFKRPRCFRNLYRFIGSLEYLAGSMTSEQTLQSVVPNCVPRYRRSRSLHGQLEFHS